MGALSDAAVCPSVRPSVGPTHLAQKRYVSQYCYGYYRTLIGDPVLDVEPNSQLLAVGVNRSGENVTEADKITLSMSIAITIYTTKSLTEL